MATERQLEILAVYEQNAGNISATARALGVSRSSVHSALGKLGAREKPLVAGRQGKIGVESRLLPAKGTVARYLLTSAQNNTRLHDKFWENLLAFAKARDAELIIGTYTYNMNAYGKLSVKRGTKKSQDELWYDERLHPYINNGDNVNIQLAPGLVWVGRANLMPTAADPLSGFKSYHGRDSCIFPHAKIALESVASGKYEPTRFNFTTGTVTQLNYIQKKAGLKAEHHHVYGAALVEVDDEGNWYVRHLEADSKGRFYDLTTCVDEGRVKEMPGKTIEAITWGDVHLAQVDPDVRELAWGKGGMLDVLRPKYQFLHDLLDFYARNPHERGNPHTQFSRFVEGADSVEREVRDAADFLHEADRPWCSTVVVDSNHDNFMARWLRDADYRSDPPNALYFLRAQTAVYQSLAIRDENFHLVEWAMQDAECPGSVQFLREDDSFVICRQMGGIECGWHGHLGPNGARGTPASLTGIGRRANTGHTHSSYRRDGLCVAGCCTQRDLGYNKGPNSNSHTHVLTYKNGKRTHVTMRAGKYRA